MRSIVLSMIISLDGFIAGPERELDWMIGPDREREAEHLQFLEHVDTMLIGHGVYHDMVGYWPTATSRLADRINATQKLVISTTPDQLEWQNARQLLVDDDLPGAIGDLKSSPGRDIVLYGGVRLAQSMTRHDLIDEYGLALTPVALGKGLPLFPQDTLRRKLSFRGVQPFASGTLLASYVPHR
jgi:dihydrofolate reductase